MADISDVISNDPNQSNENRHDHIYQRHYLVNRADTLTAAYEITLTYFPPKEKRSMVDPALVASLNQENRPSQILAKLSTEKVRCARMNCPRNSQSNIYSIKDG